VTSPRLPLKERLKKQFTEYPRIAIITYLTLSILSIVAFSIAIGMGAQPSTATGTLGVIGAGWVAAKALMPLRILATLALTPMIAAVVGRFKKPAPADEEDEDEEDVDDAQE
jgi:hypothetical protein